MGSLSKVCIESAGATYNEDYITVTNYPYYTSTVSKSSGGRLVVGWWYFYLKQYMSLVFFIWTKHNLVAIINLN